MKNLIARFVKDESGATAIEYGLIAAGISLAIITAVNGLGGKLSSNFDTSNTSLKEQLSCACKSGPPLLPQRRLFSAREATKEGPRRKASAWPYRHITVTSRTRTPDRGHTLVLFQVQF